MKIKEKAIEAVKALKPEKNQELESFPKFFPKIVRNNDIKNKIDEIK